LAVAPGRGIVPMQSSSRMSTNCSPRTIRSVAPMPNLEYTIVSPACSWNSCVRSPTRPSPTASTVPARAPPALLASVLRPRRCAGRRCASRRRRRSTAPWQAPPALLASSTFCYNSCTSYGYLSRIGASLCPRKVCSGSPFTVSQTVKWVLFGSRAHTALNWCADPGRLGRQVKWPAHQTWVSVAQRWAAGCRRWWPPPLRPPLQAPSRPSA